MLEVGDEIRITKMCGEPHYTGRVGIVQYIDDVGQIHGTFGGLALHPNEDSFVIVNKKENLQK